jgi:DNA-binding response OmpR family regulator
LRAACEAYAGGAGLEPDELVKQSAIRRRIDEFWADEPDDEAIRLSELEGQPLLIAGRPEKPAEKGFDTSQLTAKEYQLLEYFRQHPDGVCEKDDLIRAVWPEDKIFERGIRDDSLAQLIRRLREKIEADPSSPRYIHTVPGRGYRFTG